ncbi:MAG: TonB-dependent receptor domain-containing protein, partial [Gemmobacter sp.]
MRRKVPLSGGSKLIAWLGAASSGSSRARLTSFFLSDTIGLAGDKVLLTAGLRHQQIKVKSYNYYNGGALDTEYDESAVTPVVGLVVKPREGLSLFANR